MKHSSTLTTVTRTKEKFISKFWIVVFFRAAKTESFQLSSELRDFHTVAALYTEGDDRRKEEEAEVQEVQLQQGCSSASAAQEPQQPCTPEHAEQSRAHTLASGMEASDVKEQNFLSKFTVRLLAPHKCIQSKKKETRFTSSEPRVDSCMRHIYVT